MKLKWNRHWKSKSEDGKEDVWEGGTASVVFDIIKCFDRSTFVCLPNVYSEKDTDTDTPTLSIRCGTRALHAFYTMLVSFPIFDSARLTSINGLLLEIFTDASGPPGRLKRKSQRFCLDSVAGPMPPSNFSPTSSVRRDQLGRRK